jgi:hypothetical protein
MNYIYEITGWKNGSEVKFQTTPYKSKAEILALHWRKHEDVDAIDICEVTEEEGYLHTKETHTLTENGWEREKHYIGEDE